MITTADSQAVSAAGHGWKLAPGSKDPLDRYRLAGLDPDKFAPLPETR